MSDSDKWFTFGLFLGVFIAMLACELSDFVRVVRIQVDREKKKRVQINHGGLNIQVGDNSPVRINK